MKADGDGQRGIKIGGGVKKNNGQIRSGRNNHSPYYSPRCQGAAPIKKMLKKTKPTAIREKNKEKLKNKMQKYTKNRNKKKTKRNQMQKLY